MGIFSSGVLRAVATATGVFVFALLALACGQGRGVGSGGEIVVGEDGEFSFETLTGEVRINGSSTVFPISEAAAEEFSLVSRVRTNVGSSGTGGGLEMFCRGEIDVASASRPIRDGEVATCASRGIEDIVELEIAIDALTVMVHPDNDFVSCLTVQELHDIFRTGGVTNWNEVRPEFPDAPISWYFPGTDSGTFDYFVEVLQGVEENSTHRGDGTSSEDDNILVQGIQNDVYSIGYFGFAYYLEAGQTLKALEIDGGEGCVAPSSESALDGSYQPLSRPLFIYTREALLEERPEVLGFVTFYLRNAQVLAPEVGYIPLPDERLQEQMAKIARFLP